MVCAHSSLKVVVRMCFICVCIYVLSCLVPACHCKCTECANERKAKEWESEIDGINLTDKECGVVFIIKMGFCKSIIRFSYKFRHRFPQQIKECLFKLLHSKVSSKTRCDMGHHHLPTFNI